MPSPKKKSSFGNIIIGLFFIAAGIFPILATFNIGPLGIQDINGPAWLGIASGGIFVNAGIIVMIGESTPIVKEILGLLIVVGMTALANWVAFGLGERVCSGSFTFFGLLAESNFTNFACRIPFGVSALIMNGLLFSSVVSFMQKIMGDSTRMDGLKKIAEWLILISLAPILIPFLLWLFGRAATDAVRIRLKTGAWPRNESFIQKQKEKKSRRTPEQ